MKKLLLFISLVTLIKTNAQTAQFSWIAGSTFTNQSSVYGTKGVPSTTNIIGARQEAAYWTGQSNTMYVFGGTTASRLNDLWRYDINLDEWVWLTGANTGNQLSIYGTLGIASTTNTPGARTGAATWTDLNGDLWMFGGYGNAQSSAGSLNDLWKYTVADNKWMWVHGPKNPGVSGNYGVAAAPTNTPGPREKAVTWTDNSGNLWMYGGYGQTTSLSLGYLSDLWMFNVTTSMWTWVSGNSIPNANGIYGTKGVSGTTTKPSGRQSSTAWKDNAGNLWLFGGFGKSSTATNGNLNDTWKYDFGTSQWTWMSGSNLTGGSTSFGIQGTPSATNNPSARMNSVGWSDGNYFWLFGGAPYSSSTQTPYNDLWVYNSTNNSWTWVAGTFSANQVGVYGTKNVLSPSNVIGARQHACSFKDLNGDFILFGGLGYASSGAGYLNDMWKIDACYTNYAINTTGANQIICPNSSAALSATGVGVLGWYSASSGGTYLTPGSNYITPTLTTNTTFYVQDSTCGAGPRTAITVTLNSAPSVFINGGNTASCASKTVALAAGGATTYTWSTSQATQTISVAPSVTTTYTVIGTGANTCTNSAVKTITVNPLPTLTVTGNNVLCAGNSTTLTVSGANTYTWAAGFFVPTIGVSPSATTNYSVNGKDANNCVGSVAYLVTVSQLPVLNVSTTNTMICSGETATISVTGASTYTWSDNSNGADLIINPTSNANYTVTGLDANNCSNASVFTQSVSVCTSIEEQLANNSLLIFPNPNNGEFTIHSQKEDDVIIINELGQTVIVIELNQRNSFTHQIVNLRSGIYFLNGKSVKKKIVVTK